MKPSSATFSILAFVLAVATVCVLLDRPPRSVPASAPPDQFSAERALLYLNEFAQRPHPVGTPEHDRVRDYLVAQVTNLGLTPQVQRSTGVTEIYEVAGRVENILARLKGTSGSNDAVMLASHYDSVPAGPGAGDDGAGVAALLETLRALRAGPSLKNDVIFLLSDGEEEGMLGASAFVAEHPWAKDVRVGVNFEGRGNAGASGLFETSVGNGRLVRILVAAAPHVSGSSLGYEIYKHLPNDTDMTMFKKTGMAGLNFGFIGHWEAYHTLLDNPQQLDRGSLQQHGEYALSLARALGDADLAQLAAADANYFGIPGKFIDYSSGKIWPLTILAAIVFLGIAVYAKNAFPFTIGGMFVGLLAALGSLMALMLIAFATVKGVAWLHLHKLPDGDVVRSVPYVLSLIALLAAIEMALYKWLRKKLTWHSLFFGASLFVLILSILAAEWLPGASYTLVWPLLGMLLGFLFVSPSDEKPTSFAQIAAGVLALPSLVLFVALLQNFFIALGFAETGGPLLALVLFLLLMTMLPLLEILRSLSGSLVPLALFGAALFLFAGGASFTRYSYAHPKPSMMAYALDADAGKALWASSASRTDSWTAQYVSASPLRGRLTGFYPAWLPLDFLQHEAQLVSLAPPQVEMLENAAAPGGRMLRLRITSPRQARDVSVDTPESEIVEATIDNLKLGLPADTRWGKKEKWSLSYANLPAEGIELKLHSKGPDPVKIVVVDRSIGLPAIPGALFAPRPADSMPHHSGDQTMVRRSFVF